MTAVPKHTLLSVEDYLEGELRSEVRHEYLGGQVHAMSGATNRHNTIAGNAFGILYSGLRGQECQPFNSDTKVRVELSSQTRFYYPDAMVVCQKNRESESYQQSPAVIVEVLSESTRRTDFTEKKDAYLSVPSLKVLILLEQDEPFATVYRRSENGGFSVEEYFGIEKAIPLPEVGLTLDLQELYERVEF